MSEGHQSDNSPKSSLKSSSHLQTLDDDEVHTLPRKKEGNNKTKAFDEKEESLDEKYKRLSMKKEKKEEEDYDFFKEEKIRLGVAMDLIAMTHPLSRKLGIDDVFPMLTGIKRSLVANLGWGNFYDKYDEQDSLRQRNLYQPPEENNDALEFNETIDMIDMQITRTASNQEVPKKDSSKRKGIFQLQGRAGSMLASSTMEIKSKVRLHNS